MILPQELRSAAAPRRWAPFVEGLVAVALVVSLNFFFFSSAPGFFNWPFNPYLFVVLLVAGRYGLLPGLFTAFICLMAYLGSIAWLKVGVPLTLLLTPPHYGVLVTFCLGATIVGNLSDQAKRRLAQALGFYDEVKLRHERLSTQFTLLSDEKHLLDKQVLSEEETFPALVSMFDDLDRLDPNEIPPRIVTLAPRLLGGGKAAAYLFKDGARTGTVIAKGDNSWPELAYRDHLVIGKTLESDEVVTVAHLRGFLELGSMAHDPVQLGCKLPLDDEATELILIMKDLPFSGFAPSRLTALQSGLGVAGRALDRANLFKQTQDRNVEDPITKASTMTYFFKRLFEDYSVSRRHKMPISVLTVYVPRLEKRIRREQHQQLRRILADAFQEGLRDGDLLAHYKTPGSFLVLLPFTPVAGAEVVAGRFRTS